MRKFLDKETCQENLWELWKTSDINLVHLFFPHISSNGDLETMSSQHLWNLKCIIFQSAKLAFSDWNNLTVFPWDRGKNILYKFSTNYTERMRNKNKQFQLEIVKASPPQFIPGVAWPRATWKAKNCRMHSTVILFVGLASAPALFVTLVPAQRAQEQARASPAGWWVARTPLGVQGQAQENRGPASGTPPSLLCFLSSPAHLQVLGFPCWDTHRHCCELTFQKNPKTHPWFSNHFKRRALLNIHITPDPEQKAAKNTYYYSPKYHFALLFFPHERFFSATQKIKRPSLIALQAVY